MPAYSNSPFAVPQLLTKGVNTYLFGTYRATQANTRMNVSQVALASNVATVTGQIVEGEVPVVGSLISITQTANSSGLFNVQRAVVTAVSFNNNGFGTVSFALTNANVTAVADFGTAIIEVPEVAETLANVASVALCAGEPTAEGQFTITASATFPAIPTAVTVVLQEAVRNVAGEFTTLGTVATVAASAVTAGPTQQFTLTRGNFYRALVSGLSGTGTIVLKVS